MQSGHRIQQSTRVGMRGRLKNVLLAPDSTRFPAYITATRSAICETTARSCEMKSMARPNFARSSASNSRICAWMVTSSAVVGSSAISSLRPVHDRHGDHHALAHAAGKLVRIIARAAFRVGNCTVVHGLDSACQASFFELLSAMMRQHRFGNLVAHAHHRIQRGHRLLENHRRSAARAARAWILREVAKDRAVRRLLHPALNKFRHSPPSAAEADA